jgi:kinase-associated protein B
MAQWNQGDLVRVTYKTGEYIAEVLETHEAKLLVTIAAVVTYPTQGDLHNPYEVDVPLFHQRRALSYQEKIMVPLQTVRAHHGPVPDYQQSLGEALQREVEKLQKMIKWAERSLNELEQLKKEGFTNRQ